MTLALEYAEKALARGEFPVGCLMVYNGEVVAGGGRLSSRDNINELDHAEIVALRFLLKNNNKINFADITVYSTMEPCLMCFSTLLVNGIRKVVFGYEDVMGGGTNLSVVGLPPLYSRLDPQIIGGVLRLQCLELFKNFFSNSENIYLKGSYLATYTLAQ